MEQKIEDFCCEQIQKSFDMKNDVQLCYIGGTLTVDTRTLDIDDDIILLNVGDEKHSEKLQKLVAECYLNNFGKGNNKTKIALAQKIVLSSRKS